MSEDLKKGRMSHVDTCRRNFQQREGQIQELQALPEVGGNLAYSRDSSEVMSMEKREERDNCGDRN